MSESVVLNAGYIDGQNIANGEYDTDIYLIALSIGYRYCTLRKDQKH